MKSKKLALTKTTIQKLDASSLKQIKGGAAAPKSAEPTATEPSNIPTCFCTVQCTTKTA